MNERIIKIAHVVAIIIILLAAIVATAQPGQGVSGRGPAQGSADQSTGR
jgi:hypothetical protein